MAERGTGNLRPARGCEAMNDRGSNSSRAPPGQQGVRWRRVSQSRPSSEVDLKVRQTKLGMLQINKASPPF